MATKEQGWDEIQIKPYKRARRSKQDESGAPDEPIEDIEYQSAMETGAETQKEKILKGVSKGLPQTVEHEGKIVAFKDTQPNMMARLTDKVRDTAGAVQKFRADREVAQTTNRAKEIAKLNQELEISKTKAEIAAKRTEAEKYSTLGRFATRLGEVARDYDKYQKGGTSWQGYPTSVPPQIFAQQISQKEAARQQKAAIVAGFRQKGKALSRNFDSREKEETREDFEGTNMSRMISESTHRARLNTGFILTGRGGNSGVVNQPIGQGLRNMLQKKDKKTWSW